MAEKESKTPGRQEMQSQERSGTQVTRRAQPSDLWRRDYDPFWPSPRGFFSGPFSMMRRMADEMDRMFAEFGFGRSQSEGNLWSPAIEVSERDGNYVVCAELPGLKPEDVKVEVTDSAIVVQGERRSEHDEKHGGIHRSERHYGQFYRTIPLPEGANADQVRANFQNGVLEVTVPVPQQQSDRRQVKIETGSATSSSQTGTARRDAA